MDTEEYLQTFNSPTFISSLVSGILFGLCAVTLYDKTKRYGFFRPYFHLANAGLLHAVAEVLNLVYDRDISPVKNDFPLHAGLVITTIGAQCLIMMLHGFLYTWVQFGIKHENRAISILLRIIFPASILFAFAMSISGDIFLIVLDERGTSSNSQVTLSISLKLVGSIVNIVIILTYVILGLCLAATKRAKKLQNTFSVAALILITGILALIRFVYYCYLVIQTLFESTNSSIFADIAKNRTAMIIYISLIVAPELLVMLTAIVCDMTRVRNEETIILHQTEDCDDPERVPLKL